MKWDIQLSEEVDMLRETVRQFAEKRITPIAEDLDRENEFPQHLWRELGDLGLLSMTISGYNSRVLPTGIIEKY